MVRSAAWRRTAATLGVGLLLATAAAPGAASAQSGSGGNLPTPQIPMTLYGTVAFSGTPPAAGATLVIDAFMPGEPPQAPASISGTDTFGCSRGGCSTTDVAVGGSAADVGQPVSFTVDGAAASAVGAAGGGAGCPAAGGPVLWAAGVACPVALSVAGTLPAVLPTASDAATAPPGGGSVTAGGSSTGVPDTTATASGGAGTVAVARYPSDPEPAAATAFTSSASPAYFDVSVTQGSSFTSLAVTQCGITPVPGQTPQLLWWNGSAWAPVSPGAGFDSGTGCLAITLSARTSPTVAQLTGTPFVALAEAVAASGGGGGGGGGGGAASPAPTVSGITPTSGPAAGGTSVVVTGTNLSGATAVDFGTAAAASFTVDSATQITAVSPPAAAGTSVEVGVTTPAGTASTTFLDQFAYTAAAPAAQASPGTTAPSSAPKFSDVPPGYWAASAIETLAARGIINGFPGGTFEPGGDVTRAQFVKMLDLTLGLPAGAGTTPFTDVPPSAWFAPYVAAAVKAGIVSGLTPDTFGPGQAVSRQQMAVLLARALKLKGTVALSFKDAADIAPWATAGVEAAVAAGYLNGLPGGLFDPAGPTTRAQAAKVLALALQKRGS